MGLSGLSGIAALIMFFIFLGETNKGLLEKRTASRGDALYCFVNAVYGICFCLMFFLGCHFKKGWARLAALKCFYTWVAFKFFFLLIVCVNCKKDFQIWMWNHAYNAYGIIKDDNPWKQEANRFKTACIVDMIGVVLLGGWLLCIVRTWSGAF